MADEQEPETTSWQRQLDHGLFRNLLPDIRPAGKSTSIFDDTATKDLQSDVYFPLPPTPPRERRFRKNLIPGEICQHYGLQDQKLPPPEFEYGIRGEHGESTEKTFKAGQCFGIAEYRRSVAEQVYASNKHEPLGRCLNRGHSLNGARPESPSFEGFGTIKGAFPETAKEALFPRGIKEETDEVKKLYQRTHGHWQAGEQIDRNYNWPAETKGLNWKFGKSDEGNKSINDLGGSKSALSWALDEHGKIPVTRIGPAELMDFRTVARDQLGKVKNYMQGKPNVPVGHVFGKKSAGANLTAAACFSGLDGNPFTPKDVSRTLPGDEKRRFGVPSVRTDIPMPEKRSLADTQNYGQDPGSATLLNPQRFNNMGITDAEFLIRRPKDKLRPLWNATGVPPEVFEDLWPKAVALFDDGYPLVSIDSMLHMYGKEVDKHVETRYNEAHAPRRKVHSPLGV